MKKAPRSHWRLFTCLLPLTIASVWIGLPGRMGSSGAAAPFQIRIVDDSTKIRPGMPLGDPWTLGPDAKPFELEGAGGETVAFQVVLESGTSYNSLELNVGDLTGGNGKIGSDQFRVFLETYIDCPPVDAKIVSLGPGRYPDPLIPLWQDEPGSTHVAYPLELPAGQRRVLWFDIHIPRGLGQGNYRGEVEFVLGGRSSVKLPIEIEKYDFDLPAEMHLEAWVPLYVTRFADRENFDDLDIRGELEVIWRYFRMAHQHRFVTQLMEYEPKLSWNEKTGDLMSVDWTVYDLAFGPALDGTLFDDKEPVPFWKVGGFVLWGARPGDHPHFGGSKSDSRLTAAHRRALTAYAREIRRHFDQKGWTHAELFMYMIDEPDLKTYPNFPDLIADYGKTLKKSGANIGHMVTMAPSASQVTHGAIDIWAVWGAGYYPPEMQARQRLGEKTWFYQYHEPFIGGHCLNHEGLGMRSWPWIAWRYQIDGVFLWVGNFWTQNPYVDAVNWNDNLLGNGTFFYPGAMLPTIGFPAIRGPVGSFRMKALRRGLLDYDYFHLLRSLGGDPDPIVKRIVRSAVNEKGYDPIWNHPLWAKPGDWSHNPADWDAARREVAEEISKRSSR